MDICKVLENFDALDLTNRAWIMVTLLDCYHLDSGATNRYGTLPRDLIEGIMRHA